MSEPDGTTPLDQDEAADLIPSHIETRRELNSWEQANIAEAAHWIRERRFRGSVLSVEFVRELHRRMFNQTWKWAGTYRHTGKNIGVPASQIPQHLRDLLDDVAYWIKHNTYDLDEIGTRFHHRLVSIHPFPNGNGRHSRLMTDALLEQLGAPAFTWGSGNNDSGEDVRERYLAALRKADEGDYSALLTFVRA